MTLPRFTTRRLELAPATSDDLDAVWHLWQQPEVRRYLFDDVPVTRERAAEALRTTLVRGVRKVGLWTVRPRAEARVVGTVGLLRTPTVAPHDPDFVGSIEVLAAFEALVWGRGYATEALAPLIRYAFETVGLARLVAVVDVPNEASHRMVTRLGFTPTGETQGPVYRARTYALTARDYATAP